MIFKTQQLQNLKRLELTNKIKNYKQIPSQIISSTWPQQTNSNKNPSYFNQKIQQIAIKWMNQFMILLENWLTECSQKYIKKIFQLEKSNENNQAKGKQSQKNVKNYLLNITKYVSLMEYPLITSINNIQKLYLKFPEDQLIQEPKKTLMKENNFLRKQQKSVQLNKNRKSLSIESFTSNIPTKSRSKSKGRKLSFFSSGFSKQIKPNLVQTFGNTLKQSDTLNTTVKKVKKQINFNNNNTNNKSKNHQLGISSTFNSGFHQVGQTRYSQQINNPSVIDSKVLRQKLQERLSKTCNSTFFNQIVLQKGVKQSDKCNKQTATSFQACKIIQQQNLLQKPNHMQQKTQLSPNISNQISMTQTKLFQFQPSPKNYHKNNYKPMSPYKSTPTKKQTESKTTPTKQQKQKQTQQKVLKQQETLKIIKKQILKQIQNKQEQKYENLLNVIENKLNSKFDKLIEKIVEKKESKINNYGYGDSKENKQNAQKRIVDKKEKNDEQFTIEDCKSTNVCKNNIKEKAKVDKEQLILNQIPEIKPVQRRQSISSIKHPNSKEQVNIYNQSNEKFVNIPQIKQRQSRSNSSSVLNKDSSKIIKSNSNKTKPKQQQSIINYNNNGSNKISTWSSNNNVKDLQKERQRFVEQNSKKEAFDNDDSIQIIDGSGGVVSRGVKSGFGVGKNTNDMIGQIGQSNKRQLKQNKIVINQQDKNQQPITTTQTNQRRRISNTITNNIRNNPILSQNPNQFTSTTTKPTTNNTKKQDDFYTKRIKDIKFNMENCINKYKQICSKLVLPVNQTFLLLFCCSYQEFCEYNKLENLEKQIQEQLNKYPSQAELKSKLPQDSQKFILDSLTKIQKMINLKCPSQKKVKIYQYTQKCISCIENVFFQKPNLILNSQTVILKKIKQIKEVVANGKNN